MTDEQDLHAARRDARLLLRAVAAGDRAAHERTRAVLGPRLERRFVLADTLHVIAREQGAASWPALLARVRRGPIRAALDEGADEQDVSVVDASTDLRFPDGTPVTIAIKRRGRRMMLDDGGAAVARSGRPRGWADFAERAVEPSGMNVSRTTGVVFVPAWDNGRDDLEQLTHRLARASLDVLEALLELGDRPLRGASRGAG